MATVTLRKVGGSLSFAVPPAIKDALGLAAGSSLEVVADHGQIVAKPIRQKFTLDELMAQCDLSASYSEEERAWLDAPPVGRELL
jgi:antitoxin ChpS